MHPGVFDVYRHPENGASRVGFFYSIPVTQTLLQVDDDLRDLLVVTSNNMRIYAFRFNTSFD